MTQRPHSVSLAIPTLLVLLVAAPAAAQIPCEDDPYGELPDCSFEQEKLTDWTLVQGSFFGPTLADEDHPHRTGSGSGEVHAVEAGLDFYTSVLGSQCFAATPAWQSSSYGAWMRVLESFQQVNCYVERFNYEDSTCSNLLNSSATSTVTPHPGGWTESAGTGVLTGPSARLEINCQSQEAFEMQIDDAYSVRPVSCIDDPNNIVPNCSFEEGDPPNGWTPSFGDVLFQPAQPALYGSGSGAVSVDPNNGNPFFEDLRVVSSCLPLPPATQTLSFGGSVRLLSTNFGLYPGCTATLSVFEEADCGGSGSRFMSPPEGANQVDWTRFSESVDALSGASARLELGCSAVVVSNVLQVDEAFLILDIPIFLDGFESGDTSRWSSP